MGEGGVPSGGGRGTQWGREGYPVGEGQLKVHLACLRAPPIVSSPPHCLCRTIARIGSSKNIRMFIKGQTRNGQSPATVEASPSWGFPLCQHSALDTA